MCVENLNTVLRLSVCRNREINDGTEGVCVPKRWTKWTMRYELKNNDNGTDGVSIF